MDKKPETLTEEHDSVCHADGSSCEDGCDVAPLREVPPPGSWADVARELSRLFPNDGTDWDAWKDEMKEGDL